MAKSLSKSNIVTNNTILASDVSQSIDALTGTVAYDITISGSLQNTGSVGISGLLSATPGITHQLTASNAVSSSYAVTASFASSVPPGVGSKWSGSNPITREGDVEITGSLTVSGSGGKYIIAQRLQSYNNGDSSNFIAGLGAGGNLTQYPNDNVVIGYLALDAQTGLNADSYNVVIGSQAASDVNVTDKFTSNVMIGYAAGFKAGGGNNVAIGSEALKANAGSANPSQSIAIGSKALEDIQNANGNIAIGYYVGESTMVQGDENIFIGNYVNSSGYGGIDTSKQLKIGYKTIIPLSASLETGDVLFPNTASAAYFTGSFVGDGSQLTGIVSGLWTGSSGTITRESDVQISGSLSISGSLLQGVGNIVTGDFSHVEGRLNSASGDYSHAEGQSTKAKGLRSHAEGHNTIAHGNTSHAEGNYSIASGSNSHAEGNITVARGGSSHAEGSITLALASFSHAEGTATTSSGFYSHAEGSGSVAFGLASHAEGIHTIASGSGQSTVGHYNTQGNINSLFVIGNGTSIGSRSDLALFNTSSITLNASITASSNISASGVVYGKTGSFSHLQGNSPFTIGDQVTFQQPTTASRLLISGSTTSTLDTARLRVGNYFANGGAAVS